jgi:hypothetical protein
VPISAQEGFLNEIFRIGRVPVSAVATRTIVDKCGSAVVANVSSRSLVAVDRPSAAASFSHG